MTLQECLQRLAYGLLSNLWGNSQVKGTIPEDKVPLVVNALNEALLRLYTRFNLKEDTLFLELHEHKTIYKLTSDHIIPSNYLDLPLEERCEKYIFDTPENPFLNNIIKITRVFTSNGIELPLNNNTAYISVYTPSFNTLQVPLPIEGLVLCVSYQAKPQLLSNTNISDQKIDIPDTLLGALFAYVAYIIHANMNTELAIANAQKYLSIYQSIVNEVIETDSVNSSYSQINTKFYNQGWC